MADCQGVFAEYPVNILYSWYNGAREKKEETHETAASIKKIFWL